MDILKSEKCSRHGHSSTSLSFSAFHKNRRYLTCTKSHWSVIFFRTRLHVPTYKSAWIRTDILIQIKKEMSLKLSIHNIFFFQVGRLSILHVLHRYHQGFWDFKFTCTWTTFKWNFENAKVSVNIHEIFLTKSILHLSHFTVDQKWQKYCIKQ